MHQADIIANYLNCSQELPRHISGWAPRAMRVADIQGACMAKLLATSLQQLPCWPLDTRRSSPIRAQHNSEVAAPALSPIFTAMLDARVLENAGAATPGAQPGVSAQFLHVFPIWPKTTHHFEGAFRARRCTQMFGQCCRLVTRKLVCETTRRASRSEWAL